MARRQGCRLICLVFDVSYLQSRVPCLGATPSELVSSHLRYFADSPTILIDLNSYIASLAHAQI